MPHIIGGITAVVLGVAGVIHWWDNFGDFLRGFIPLVLLVGGITAISVGWRFKARMK